MGWLMTTVVTLQADLGMVYTRLLEWPTDLLSLKSCTINCVVVMTRIVTLQADLGMAAISRASTVLRAVSTDASTTSLTYSCTCSQQRSQYILLHERDCTLNCMWAMYNAWAHWYAHKLGLHLALGAVCMQCLVKQCLLR